MEYDIDLATEVLGRTPGTLTAMLSGAPDEWTRRDEGPDTWSAFDVVAHMADLEDTDWMGRVRVILEHGADRPFTPVDRFAFREWSRGRTSGEVVEEFRVRRVRNLDELRALELGPADLERSGQHPDLGPVVLRQLLAAWVVHDLTHIAQIGRVMAKQYREAVGPWRQYLPLLDR